MATSGTYLWSPELADCVDDAFERCKVDPGTLDVSHILSARRSINFLLVEWAVQDYHEFRVDRLDPFALTESIGQYTIDPDSDGRIIDILAIALRRDGIDTPLTPLSRQEWLDIPDKDQEGRTSRYFADKRQSSIVLDLWQVPNNSTDTLIIEALRKFEDAGGLGNEPDIPYYMREAFAAGLAAKLGQKFAPAPILQDLRNEAARTFSDANGAQRERNDVVISVGSTLRSRRGRRTR